MAGAASVAERAGVGDGSGMGRAASI